MRVGYCLGQPAITDAVRAVAPPFPLSGAAIAVALAALEAPDAVAARVAESARERVRMTDGLRALGLPVAKSRANFIWLPVGAAAETLTARLAAASIAVRCFAGEGVRITTGTGRHGRRSCRPVGLTRDQGHGRAFELSSERMNQMKSAVILGAAPVTLEGLVTVARQGAPVSLADEARAQMRVSEDWVAGFSAQMDRGEPTQAIYSINTGFGSLQGGRRSRPRPRRGICRAGSSSRTPQA